MNLPPVKKEFSKNNSPQLAYVILSDALGRDEYVKECIRLHTVNVVTTTGTIYTSCPLMFSNLTDTDGDLKMVGFPDNKGELGSPVVLLFPEGYDKPIVIGVLASITNNIILENEHQQILSKETKECSIQIMRDPVNGNYSINIYGRESKKANFDINVGSLNKDGKLKINVQGDMETDVTGVKNINIEDEVNMKIRNLTKQEEFTEIKYKLNEGLTITDEFKNVLKLNEDGLDIILEKDVKMNIAGKADINVTGDAKIDAAKIDIGNAESLALNMSCICQYTGQKHLAPVTNTKTKV